MKLIVCLDDRNGMLFNGRRLSRDSLLRKRIKDITQGRTLWMNSYSADQFAEEESGARVSEAFLEKCGAGEYCFVENTDIRSCVAAVEELTVYRWNRLYPSDTVFPMEVFGSWKKVSSFEFQGSSHEKLTEEVYRP